MGCDNGNTEKCSACWKGAADPLRRERVYAASEPWWAQDQDKLQTKAERHKADALAHKAFHKRRRHG